MQFTVCETGFRVSFCWIRLTLHVCKELLRDFDNVEFEQKVSIKEVFVVIEKFLKYCIFKYEIFPI